MHRVLEITSTAAVLTVLVTTSAATQVKLAAAAASPAEQKRSVPRSPAAGRSASEFHALAANAQAARESGRLAEAADLYRRATQLRPGWIEGKWYLGTVYYEMDLYADARTAFRAVTAAQPTNGPAHGFKGLCEFRLKNYEAALSDVMRAKQLGLGSNQELEGSIHYHAALIMTRLGQYELALMELMWFAEKGNDSPRVIEAFGLAALRMQLLPAELPIDRREMVMLAGRGSYYQAARLNGLAKPAFEELATRYADAANVHYAYGTLLLSEDPDGAIEEFRKELRLTPGHVPALLQIAFEYIKRSDWKAAEPWARQAAEIAPTDFVARRALGQVLLESGDAPGAIQQLEAGVELAPGSPSLRFVLARAYQKAGRFGDARRERGEFERLRGEAASNGYGYEAVGVAGPTAP